MSNWQPIETAPRDGTEILLGHFCDYGDDEFYFYCMTDYLDRDGYWSNYTHMKYQPQYWTVVPTPPQRIKS